MFIRVNSTPNSPRRSIQIVESRRNGNKVSQKIVRYVGVAMDEQEEQKLRDLAVEIMAKMEYARKESAAQKDLFGVVSETDIKSGIGKRLGRPRRKRIEDILPPDQVTLDDVVEKTRVIEGIHEVAGKVYDDLYGEILRSKKQNAILKDLVLARLAKPCSKYQSQKMLMDQFDITHSLDAIYRAMDATYAKIPTIKKITFERTKNLFPQGIDLLLFDVTTLYFESTTSDEIREFGYSKDHRFNTTQVVLALATNSDGLPIGYELFEGNKAEVSTLIDSIKSWGSLFKIGTVCFVGDRAMMSRKNLELLDANGHQYIIAAKLRSLPEALKAEVLDKSTYTTCIEKEDTTLIREFSYEKRRLIVSFKKKRALKDAKDREAILTKIKKRLSESSDTKKLITNSGVKKYTTTNQSKTVLDEEKVSSDAQWDGLHGVVTNITDPLQSLESILGRYSALWKIEESFRINKHTLKMRPIFHFKPERIQAHIAICYMAFATLRNLEYQVSLCQKVSVQTILKELFNVQSSIHQHKVTKDLYKLPGAFSQIAQKIYKALAIERSLDASIYRPS